MIVIGSDVLDTFAAKHPDGAEALKAWKKLMRENNFKHFPQMKQAFASADYVKPFTVFDIGGNKYRLISRINYGAGVVSVAQIMPHKDYDKGKWRES